MYVYIYVCNSYIVINKYIYIYKSCENGLMAIHQMGNDQFDHGTCGHNGIGWE
jgi:hypothetical protein